jgi:hypothetical protein
MVDRTLADFVKEALAGGASRDEIERALAQAGWPPEQVRSALAAYADTPFPVPVPLPRAYVSAREAFLYLILFIVLGVLAGHLGGLLFALIDVLLPRDANPDINRVQAASGAIRWAVAALAVALPLYLILTWRLIRARRRNPAMQGSRIRKWLTYLTLVIAASTLIGDLIAVVYNLLSGELTLRFVLKAGVIAAIAGAIFLYYVRDAERDEDDAPVSLLDRVLGVGVTGAALAASIAGVMLIESPAALRARERDGARLDSLVHIAGAVDCYYTYEGDTPESLEAMRAALDERANTTTVEYACSWYEETDPATGAPFEYHRLGPQSFEVCAAFDRASDALDARATRTYSWREDRGARTFNAAHNAGRQCFTLEAESLAQ